MKISEFALIISGILFLITISIILLSKKNPNEIKKSTLTPIVIPTYCPTCKDSIQLVEYYIETDSINK